MSRRVVVHRWPAVPTAPNNRALKARPRFADWVTIIALLPPSSKSVRPSLRATVSETVRPIRVEPVAETSGTRASSANKRPMTAPPTARLQSAGSTPHSRQTCSAIFAHAIAVKGVFSEGFHKVESPHVTASALFQDQTAAGKLNAE